MKIRLNTATWPASLLAALLSMLSPTILAQVPVDDAGNAIGSFELQTPTAATGDENIPLLSTVDLEELVGPIALYPDDLLAVVLPAAAYPLQIIDAARFLEKLESDPDLKPDPEWDDSVVALLNYPEVIKLLNDDIDWTWQLGEAVVAQQADVVAAIETFRDRAYAAGNLKSDSYQNVSRDEGVIEITPVSEDVIYVPYYEPERVVVYQPRPVYYYYPRAYPVYFYPYSSSYYFDHGPFWGVTTAFRIGWFSDSLHVFHHSYYGHPYFGRSYVSPWWYRRPSINIYNLAYGGRDTRITVNRYYGGDRWRPRHDRRKTLDDVRVAHSRSYPRSSRQRNEANAFPGGRHGSDTATRLTREDVSVTRSERDGIRFRDRPAKFASKRHEVSGQSRDTKQVPARSPAPLKERRASWSQSRDVVKFRDRGDAERAASHKAERKITESQPLQWQARKEKSRSSSPRRGSVNERTSNRPAKTVQTRSDRPGYKSSSERRRSIEATPKLRAAKPTQVTRRAEPAQRATTQRTASRSEPAQQSQRSKSNTSSKRRAERSQSPSVSKFAARSRQRD